MMPTCEHKGCKKAADIEVGKVYNYEDSQIHNVYDPIYMCTKHAWKFIKKYGHGVEGGKNDRRR